MKKILKFIVSSLFLASFFVVGCAQNPGGNSNDGAGETFKEVELPKSEGNDPLDMISKRSFSVKIPTEDILSNCEYEYLDLNLFRSSFPSDNCLLDEVVSTKGYMVDFPKGGKLVPDSTCAYFDYSYKENVNGNGGFIYLNLRRIRFENGQFEKEFTAKNAPNPYAVYTSVLFNKIIVLEYTIERSDYGVSLEAEFVKFEGDFRKEDSISTQKIYGGINQPGKRIVLSKDLYTPNQSSVLFKLNLHGFEIGDRVEVIMKGTVDKPIDDLLILLFDNTKEADYFLQLMNGYGQKNVKGALNVQYSAQIKKFPVGTGVDSTVLTVTSKNNTETRVINCEDFSVLVVNKYILEGRWVEEGSDEKQWLVIKDNKVTVGTAIQNLVRNPIEQTYKYEYEFSEDGTYECEIDGNCFSLNGDTYELINGSLYKNKNSYYDEEVVFEKISNTTVLPDASTINYFLGYWY